MISTSIHVYAAGSLSYRARMLGGETGMSIVVHISYKVIAGAMLGQCRTTFLSHIYERGSSG